MNKIHKTKKEKKNSPDISLASCKLIAAMLLQGTAEGAAGLGAR